jgi:hypothetical protein
MLLKMTMVMWRETERERETLINFHLTLVSSDPEFRQKKKEKEKKAENRTALQPTSERSTFEEVKQTSFIFNAFHTFFWNLESFTGSANLIFFFYYCFWVFFIALML